MHLESKPISLFSIFAKRIESGSDMDTPFVYSTYVTGRNFIGRKAECNILGNLLGAGENVVIYGPPRSGKKSLVQQTLFNMRISGKQFSACDINLFNIRSLEKFLTCFGSAVIRSCFSTPGEYQESVSRLLDGTHFIFDKERFSRYDEVVSLNWAPDADDIRAMLALPGRIAAERGMKIFVLIEEFQNLMEDGRFEEIFSALKETMHRNSGTENSCCFIFSGSRVNAMKYIFEDYKYFHKLVEHVPIQEIDEMEIIEHVMRGFQNSGKVIEQEMILWAARLFKGNMWYINHFMATCDSMTKGFINEGILMEALRMVISVHEPHYLRIMENLTGHQTSLLRAVLEGVVKFSATDIIEKYSLNSSANVRRVKDALCKKEIITFNDREEPSVLDPLFEYWLRKYYFEIPDL